MYIIGAVEMKDNPSKAAPASISAYTAGKATPASAPPLSPPKPMARMPQRSPASPTSAGAGNGGAKPGRVLSAKRQRPRHEEMI